MDGRAEGRPRLTAAVIVKDEAEHLAGCLASLRGAVDEIVVVDTGSTDGSVAVAQGFGAVVLHHEWAGNFSDARNRGLDRATGEWILYIDADERLQVPAGALRSAVDRDDAAACWVLFQPRVRSSPSAVCARARMRFAPTRISHSGFAFRFTYQPGCVGAPPLEPMTRYFPSISW